MYKTKVVVKSRGEVIWNAPVTWKISCSSDVTWFPVDEQVCEKLTDFVITFTHIRYFTVWFKNLFFESLFILNLYCARTMVNLIWLSFFCIMLTEKFVASRYVWCSGQHYYTTSFSKVWIHFLHKFQSFSPRVRGFSCENLWQWSRLEIKLNGFCRSNIPETIHYHHHHALNSSLRKPLRSSQSNIDSSLWRCLLVFQVLK